LSETVTVAADALEVDNRRVNAGRPAAFFG
jgi:hypothetical protein